MRGFWFGYIGFCLNDCFLIGFWLIALIVFDLAYFFGLVDFMFVNFCWVV